MTRLQLMRPVLLALASSLLSLLLCGDFVCAQQYNDPGANPPAYGQETQTETRTGPETTAQNGFLTNFWEWANIPLAVFGAIAVVMVITGLITCLCLFCICPPTVQVRVKKRRHDRDGGYRGNSYRNTSTSYGRSY